ncbi:Os01g0705750, partial [Oryza sativa Japonica Group]
ALSRGGSGDAHPPRHRREHRLRREPLRPGRPHHERVRDGVVRHRHVRRHDADLGFPHGVEHPGDGVLVQGRGHAQHHLVLHCLHLHGRPIRPRGHGRVAPEPGLQLLDVRDGVAEQGRLVHLGDLGHHRAQRVEPLVQLLPPLPLRLHVVQRLLPPVRRLAPTLPRPPLLAAGLFLHVRLGEVQALGGLGWFRLDHLLLGWAHRRGLDNEPRRPWGVASHGLGRSAG